VTKLVTKKPEVVTKKNERLSDAQLRTWKKNPPKTTQDDLPDGSVSGLVLRRGPFAMTWSLRYRVRGEGGISKRGRKKNGRLHRLPLGEYPAMTLELARSTANDYLDQAKRGIDPATAVAAAAVSGAITVEQLVKGFIEDYVKLKELRSLLKYQGAVDTHIVPLLGRKLAAIVTRDEITDAVKKAIVKKPRGDGPRDRPRGGKEAARTMLSVLRRAIRWGIDEKKFFRPDNPASNMESNLPKKKKGGRALSMDELRDAWQAAADIGYPFGPVYQLDALTGNRRIEWAACKVSYLHLKEGLQIIPAGAYKSDHVHVVPLVPEAVQILEWTLEHHYPTQGEYLFSGTNGRAPISGWSKAQTRLLDAICANTGAMPVRWTPHAIRRAVATMVAQILGMSGDKIVKRVLGHADQEVTSLYNQYQYTKEVRRVLSLLTADIMSTGQCRMTYRLENSRFAAPAREIAIAHAA
jgi:integrase